MAAAQRTRPMGNSPPPVYTYGLGAPGLLPLPFFLLSLGTEICILHILLDSILFCSFPFSISSSSPSQPLASPYCLSILLKGTRKPLDLDESPDLDDGPFSGLASPCLPIY